MAEQPRDIAPPPVDLTALRKNVGGKIEMIGVLVNHILVEYPEKMHQLRLGVERRDAGQVRALAHTLKSSLASFGASEARDIAHDLEVACASGELAEAGRMLSALDREIERIVVFFSSPHWREKG